MDGGCFIDRELALDAEDTTRVEIDFGDLPRNFPLSGFQVRYLFADSVSASFAASCSFSGTFADSCSPSAGTGWAFFS